MGDGCGARLLCGHIAPHCFEEPSVGGLKLFILGPYGLAARSWD